MDDVVSRLRASKQQAKSDDYRQGHEAGGRWAAQDAEFQELANLRRSRHGYCAADWHASFELSGVGGAWSAAQRLYFAIRPDDDGAPELAADFWEGTTPEESPTPSAQWVKGFAEGALAVFDQVADQL